MTLQRLQANQKWDKQSENILNSWPKQIEAISSSISVINATLTQINYTEGTFTPAVTFGGGSTGITYTTQTGFYERIGRMVHVEIAVLLSAKGSSTGAAVITGLPLTVAATSAGHYQMSAMTAGVGDTYLQGAFSGASTNFNLQDIAAGSAAQITEVDFSDTTLIRINGVYRTSA
jgi:hypothetical protein